MAAKTRSTQGGASPRSESLSDGWDEVLKEVRGPDIPPHAMTAPEFAEEHGLNPVSASQRLRALWKEGKLERARRTLDSPYQYWPKK